MSTYVLWIVVSAVFTAIIGWFSSPAEKEAEKEVTWFGSVMKVLSGLGIDVPKVLSGLKDMLGLMLGGKK